MIRENKPGGTDRPQEQQDEGRFGGRMGEQAKDAAHDIADEARRQAYEAAHHISESGERIVEEQKNNISRVFADLAAALRQAGDRLNERNDPILASYVQTLANQCDRACHYLDEHGTRELLQEVQNLVKRRPEIFIGAMFVIGLGVARFFKASQKESSGFEESQRRERQPYGYPDEQTSYQQYGGLGEPSVADVSPESEGTAMQDIGGPPSESGVEIGESESLPSSHFSEESSPSEPGESDVGRSPDRPDYSEEI